MSTFRFGRIKSGVATVLRIILISIVLRAKEGLSDTISNGSCQWDSTRENNPTVYWINVENSNLRRQYMQDHLESLSFKHHRVVAVSPSSPTYNLSKLQKPCKRNTEKDISTIMSHLKAIHTAIYSNQSYANHSSKRQLRKELRSKKDASTDGIISTNMSDYALIMEDDVKFIYQLNFTSLILSAPKNFGILQLSTSNEEALHHLWSTFTEKSNIGAAHFEGKSVLEQNNLRALFDSNTSSSNWWTYNHWNSQTKDKRTTLYWSAQAYIINKKIVKPFIDDVIDTWSNGSISFKIVNGFNQRYCQRSKNFPCILANCLFADTYIYAGGGPTYVSHIPLFTGANVGLKSDMHQEQVGAHKVGFDAIDDITKEVRRGTYLGSGTLGPRSLLIPSFIMNPRKCTPQSD